MMINEWHEGKDRVAVFASGNFQDGIAYKLIVRVRVTINLMMETLRDYEKQNLICLFMIQT